ncbi:hypothetical protein BC828DRAFT_271852 [Blastocladiella britannica]|nr:hypothetical protein BC828DRAFT_271852 [Blastocladiella britannica]
MHIQFWDLAAPPLSNVKVAMHQGGIKDAFRVLEWDRMAFGPEPVQHCKLIVRGRQAECVRVILKWPTGMRGPSVQYADLPTPAGLLHDPFAREGWKCIALCNPPVQKVNIALCGGQGQWAERGKSKRGTQEASLGECPPKHVKVVTALLHFNARELWCIRVEPLEGRQ